VLVSIDQSLPKLRDHFPVNLFLRGIVINDLIYFLPNPLVSKSVAGKLTTFYNIYSNPEWFVNN